MRIRRDRPPMDDTPFWKQRSWQLSAAFGVLVILAGLVTAVVGLPDLAGGGRPKDVAGPLTTSLPAGSARPPGCHTDDSDQKPPSRPPDDITWKPLNGANIPMSATAGPMLRYGAVLWCLAHTPMGAVMAVNIIPRQMSGVDWQVAADQQLIDGPMRDVFVARRSSIAATTPEYTANSPAGFRLLSYSPQVARVSLLIRVSPTEFASTELTASR